MECITFLCYSCSETSCSQRNETIGWYLNTVSDVICFSLVLNTPIPGGWAGGPLGRSVRLFFTDSYFFSELVLDVMFTGNIGVD